MWDLFLMDIYHSTIRMEEGYTSILPLGDISPFFYWALAIKRITLFGLYRNEFIYFLFGFLNGIYSSKLEVKD